MIDGQRVIAVVIGRAGSRGLPNKNVLPVAGQPMIRHTINDALATACVDRVVVSTDGGAIANAARSADVEVIIRPEELAHDNATVDSAVRHAVETVDDDAPIIVVLYANVPVRPACLLDRAIALLVETGADSVQSYCDVGKYHPFWMMQVDAGTSRVTAHIENSVFRRQDLPPLVIPDGGVIAVTHASMFRVDPVRPHAFLGDDRRAIITQPGEVVDVDSEVDLRMAEAILTAQLPSCHALATALTGAFDLAEVSGERPFD